MDDKAHHKLSEVRAIVAATTNPRVATFVASRIRRSQDWPRRLRRRGFLLSPEELATLYHPDTATVGAAKMIRNDARKLEPPHDLPLSSKESELAELGRAQFRSQNDRFGIRAHDRRRHVYMIGQTGVGKSTLQRNMMTADIYAGRGLCLLDPHGDLASEIARSVPRRRWQDVVLFDPADADHPIAYNPLACPDRANRHLVAGNVLSTFEHIYGNSWGPRMASIFRNALIATMDLPHPTLVALFQFITDDDYRAKNLKHVQNPLVKQFWTKKFATWNTRFRQEAIEPVLNKLESYLTDPRLLRILAQQHNKLDLRSIMDEEKILIVNLSKGNIGEDASNLLGSLLVSSMQQAAMSRSNVSEQERKDFYFYVDEFQNFATPVFATILSEARKYRLNLTIAHQFLGQLEDDKVRHAVFGNAGTLVAFGIGNEDAEPIAEQFGGGLMPADLVRLPIYHAYVGLEIGGKTSDPFLMQTLKPEKDLQSPRSYEALLTQSRNRYATNAEEVDKKLQKQLGLS